MTNDQEAVMETHDSTTRHLAAAGGRMLGHVAAIVLGLALMFAGIAMGVTLVLLPLGVPLGLGGLMLFLWGLFSLPTRPAPPAD
jgi:hypothetical protein